MSGSIERYPPNPPPTANPSAPSPSETQLIQLTHCRPLTRVISLGFPQVCPLCLSPISSTSSPSSTRLGRTVPSPFRFGPGNPHTILVRPAKGTFLEDYAVYDDLHVGVTDSRGVPFDFDRGGVTAGGTYWNQCLVVDLNKNKDCPTDRSWDEVLYKYADETRQQTRSGEGNDGDYNVDVNNCFDFVLGFLSGWNDDVSELDGAKSTREERREAFTRIWIAPALQKALKYITLYRETKARGVLIYEDG